MIYSRSDSLGNSYKCKAPATPGLALYKNAAVDGGKRKTPVQMHGSFGADYGVRTRYLHLGKVALYQMS